MPKSAKRNVTVATSSTTSTAKPVSKRAKRNVAIAGAEKPVAIGPVAPLHTNPVAAGIERAARSAERSADANHAADTQSRIAATEAAVMPRGLARDAAGIVRYATNYAVYSDRDSAYLAFFGNVLRQHANAATLRQIHDAGITRSGFADRKRFNPNYSGSGKATDVGAINRLCKAGYFSRSADGNTITATALALSSRIYLGSKA